MMSMRSWRPAEDEPGGSRLILLVVLRPGVVLDDALTARLRSELFTRGSAALVPARIAQIDALPVTNSGKRSEAAARDAVAGRPVRNRDALQNPDCLEAIANHPALRTLPPVAQQRGQQIHHLAAGDALERELQAICERVLGVSSIQWSDNFLQCGADSLTILNLFMEIEKRTKCDLPIAALFETPTIASLAALIRGIETDSEATGVRAPSCPQIRRAGPADIEPLCRFLHHGFIANPVPSATWRRLFDYKWLDEKPDFGLVLTIGDEIVGFLGAIYAWRKIRGKTGLVCNLTSLYVLLEYRGWGAALLARAVRDKDITITALTPAPIVRHMLEAMHFATLSTRKIALPPLYHIGTLRQPRPLISFDPEIVRRSLDDDHRRIFDDHVGSDCLQLVLRAGSEHAFLVVKRNVKRAARLMGVNIPYSDILYCSEPRLLARHLEWAKLAIMRRQRTLFLFADERIFPVQPRGVAFEDLQFYRSPQFDAADLDKLYSELVLLPR
jgi:acetoacetyl-CoA synthetase